MISKKTIQSVLWNLLLITIGSIIYAIGINGIIVHNNFIPGGIFGVALLLEDTLAIFSPAIWFFLLNIPLFCIGWFFVGKKFFYYSLYGMIVITAATEFITLNFHVNEQIYAAVAGGLICGIGTGLVLRSLGSGGGLDIIAIALYTKFNIGVGKVYLIFNVVLFAFVIKFYNSDIVVASVILTYINSTTIDRIISLFNQRKIVYVISDFSQKIAQVLLNDMSQRATFIKGQGAFSGQDTKILMTITNNLQLKKLEDLIFNIDEHALFIVENSFNVIGSTIGKRKIY
jgi:uncharacterized membrane-anchored protein YitT (DUF2179 family)